MSLFIPDPVIKRLPVYYRHLRELHQNGVEQISSQRLAEIMNLTASQIRQDINRIGATGRQGYGYLVSELESYIGGLMGMDQPHRMMIVGAGNIGHALILSDSISPEGFETVAIFDNDPAVIGQRIGSLTVRSSSEIPAFLTEETVDIAALALPAHVTRKVAEELLALGVHGFWNFAPVDLEMGKHAAVVNVHLTDGLEVLSYQLRQLRP